MLREKSRLEAELDRLDTLKNCHASMLDWQEMAQELSGGAEIKEGDRMEIRFGNRVGKYEITDVREVENA